MYVGVLEMRLHVPASGSLKAKRRVVSQIKDKVRARFNCAVSEVADMDTWQLATIGVSVVSNEGGHANSCLDRIADYIESLAVAEVLDRSLEILSVKEG
jgi:uncharacterized protein